MKKIMTGISCLLSLSLLGQVSGDSIAGVWLNEKKEAKVVFYKDDGKYFGKVIWLQPSLSLQTETPKDINNPDPALRSRSILNMHIVENLSYKDGQYQDGTAYNPRMGRYFKCKAWLTSKSKMKIRGYWGFLFVTETWERVR